MAIKRMSEYKREDYVYDSPDGEKWEIQILQTSDRKYVIIKKDEGEDGEGIEVQWDVEMLLDIADVVQNSTRKSIVPNGSHCLQKPNIIDHRVKSNVEENVSPSDVIQASVEESMEKIDASAIPPVQSFFSPKRDVSLELERKNASQINVDENKKIRRS